MAYFTYFMMSPVINSMHEVNMQLMTDGAKKILHKPKSQSDLFEHGIWATAGKVKPGRGSTSTLRGETIAALSSFKELDEDLLVHVRKPSELLLLGSESKSENYLVSDASSFDYVNANANTNSTIDYNNRNESVLWPCKSKCSNMPLYQAKSKMSFDADFVGTVNKSGSDITTGNNNDVENATILWPVKSKSNNKGVVAAKSRMVVGFHEDVEEVFGGDANGNATCDLLGGDNGINAKTDIGDTENVKVDKPNEFANSTHSMNLTTSLRGHFVLHPLTEKYQDLPQHLVDLPLVDNYSIGDGNEENSPALKFQYNFSLLNKRDSFQNLGKVPMLNFLREMGEQVDENAVEFLQEMTCMFEYLQVFINKCYGKLDWNGITILAKEEPSCRIPLLDYTIEPNELVLDTRGLQGVKVERNFSAFDATGVDEEGTKKWFRIRGTKCYAISHQILSQTICIQWDMGQFSDALNFA